MSVQEMLKTHPSPALDGPAVVECVQACLSCAATCTSCADACLGEETVSELVACIRLDLDCADMCEAAGRILTRQTSFDGALARVVLEACAALCRACADECDRHARHHEHCRVCAEECRRCEEACNQLLSEL